MSVAEQELKLTPYDEIMVFEVPSPSVQNLISIDSHTVVQDYNELIIQFGYMTFFATNFPLVPLLALLNNMVELRSDAIKLCYYHQRPMSERGEGMGMWQGIINTATFVAVTTNCAYIFFIMDLTSGLSMTLRVWLFFLSEHVIYLLKLMIETSIPDMPGEVREERWKAPLLDER